MNPAWEDLDAFFDTDDFAVPATITRKAGGVIQVKGQFDDPYLNAALGEFERDDIKPKFTCRMDQVTAVVRFDTITIGGMTYDILSAPHGDGTGVAVLELARQ